MTSESTGAVLPLAQRVRVPGDMILWEREVERHVRVALFAPTGYYSCEHMVTYPPRYQKFWIRLKENPDHVHAGQMCPECYQKLREAGIALRRGVWEGYSVMGILGRV